MFYPITTILSFTHSQVVLNPFYVLSYMQHKCIPLNHNESLKHSNFKKNAKSTYGLKVVCMTYMLFKLFQSNTKALEEKRTNLLKPAVCLFF